MSTTSASLELIKALDGPVGGFAPAAILDSLLHEEESHFGEKDLLFTGFFSWVCFPDDISAFKRAVIFRLFRKLDYLERLSIRSS